ncbi:MAG: multidrug resistance protein [Ignavibacteriales bacterium]
MSLYKLSIDRPVLAVVISLFIVIFGVLGYTYLGVREYPNIDPPIVNVTTSFTGASADVIESQITEPLEESINGIAGIRSLTSTSRDGRSSITVEFDLSVDMEAGANDVRDRVSRAISLLPPDADPPIIAKADADAIPIVFLNVKSEKRSLLELSAIANNFFKERLQTITGVSQVQIWGERRYAMRIWLDPVKLASYKLTPLEVFQAIGTENLELPSGRLEGKSTELTIRTIGLLKTPEDFNNLIVSTGNNTLVRLKDIGYAELGAENERTVLRRDGIAMVGVVLVPQPGSNHIQIVDEFYRRLEILKKDMPQDLELGIGFDVTRFIRKSISEVEETILLAFGLVILIIFLFLRDWKSTFIPVIVIPISLIGTFFILYLMDFSINVLTLLGIVLAIGLVVDDAIVVLENIYTKIESGVDSKTAGYEGTKEIFFAVISTTAALVSVFLPLLFLQGLTGRLFKEFGVMIGSAVAISSLIALTLTPMLVSRFFRNSSKHSKFYYATEPFFTKLNRNYEWLLKGFVKRPVVTIAVLLFAFTSIYYFTSTMQSELAPIEDRSQLRVQITGFEGATFEYMDDYLAKMLAASQETAGEETEAFISVTAPGFGGGSVNSGFIRLILKDPEERVRTQQEVFTDLNKTLTQFTDVRAILIQEPSIGTRGGRGLPVQYVIQANDLEKLRKVIPKFMEEVGKSPVFAVSDINLKFNKPEIVIDINRNKAKDMGVSVQDVARTLQLAYSGRRFGYYVQDGKQYQILGQMSRYNRADPQDLKVLYVRSKSGELVQLDNIVTMRESSNPPQLYRFNRYVSATVSAGLAPGRTISDGIDEMDRIKASVLDESFSTALDGASKDFKESSSSIAFIFLLALVLIYLVLSAQFESFRSPFIIMFTVPLALSGALLSLWYFNQTLNIFSEIGMVMLIGLVTKNGILIVEFANQRREQGMSVYDSVVNASVSRLRPILMTSLSTILGILPIALALGAGSESRVSMGIAVVGGMIFATGLTLFIIPSLYLWIAPKDSTK